MFDHYHRAQQLLVIAACVSAFAALPIQATVPSCTTDATTPRFSSPSPDARSHSHRRVCAPQAPEGYEALAVFIANGELPGDEPQALVGDFSFFTDIMHWDTTTIDQWRQEKLDRLADKIGVDDPANHPDLQVLMGTTNPNLNYHVVSFTGRAVPPEGWRVREGFLIAVVTNPAGLSLAGELEGLHVPVGTIVGGGGVYNLEVTNRHGHVTGEDIVFHFTTALPIQTVASGVAAFTCDVESDRFGAGIGQGIISNVPIGDGMVKANFRNVLTFSAQDGL